MNLASLIDKLQFSQKRAGRWEWKEWQIMEAKEYTVNLKKTGLPVHCDWNTEYVPHAVLF